MFRLKKAIPALVVALVVMHLGVTGCDNESGMGTVSSIKGNLDISFEPNPAILFPDLSWGTFIVLRETNGIGVHLYGMIFERYSLAGELTHEGDVEQHELERGLLFCGGDVEGNFILPGGTACMLFIVEGNPNYPGYGYQILTLYGVDDLGNEVVFKGRYEMNES